MELINSLISIVQSAGDATMETFQSEALAIQSKDDLSPLTKADQDSHNIIVSMLHDAFPEIPIISEESFQHLSTDERQSWDTFWLVDPLDGTKEFINGSDEFVTMIALIENSYPTVGIIYQPTTQNGIFSKQSSGAFSFHASLKPTKITTNTFGSTNQLRSLISKNHASKEQLFIKEKFPSFDHEFIGMGSGLKFCDLAHGNSDIYLRLGPTYEWDTAAGQIILEESGYAILDLATLSPLTYNKPSLKNNGFICLPQSLTARL